jgi:hypothetical protein
MSLTSCALDVAERGHQLTFGQLGELLGVTDERARVIARRAIAKLRAAGVDLEDPGEVDHKVLAEGCSRS